MRSSLIFIAVFGLAGIAMAQDRVLNFDQLPSPPQLAVDQIVAPAAALTETQMPYAIGVPFTPGQIPGYVGGSEQNQLTTSDPSAETPQLSRAGISPGLAALPPGLVDACEEAAAGRRPPPDAVDCSVVLEAVAEVARPSAEEALLLGTDGLLRQQQQNAQTGQSQSFDANDVARRLASGDVQNAPLAQAIASGINPPTPSNPAPQGNGPVTIIPGRSGAGSPPPSGN